MTDNVAPILRGRMGRIIASKGGDQYMLRLPPGMRQQLADRARANGRSINTEVVDAIQRHLDGVNRIAALEVRIAALEKRL